MAFSNINLREDKIRLEKDRKSANVRMKNFCQQIGNRRYDNNNIVKNYLLPRKSYFKKLLKID